MSFIIEKLKLFKRNRMMCEIKMNEVRQIIELTQLEVYSQPIVQLDQQQTGFAFEYLNRPREGSGFDHPGEFYAFAANHGTIAEVDVCAIENILAHLPERVQETIFVNIHLSTLFSDRWVELLEHLNISYSDVIPQIVLEISEREGLDKYTTSEVGEKIWDLRALGFQFAIDDVGIGYSGLTSLTMVKPDYVKIDRLLVSYIDTDPYRQHLLKALVEYWINVNVSVIAEGIERKEEMDFFAKLGVTFGQGYFFQKPVKLSTDL